MISKYLPPFLLNDLAIRGLHDAFINEGETFRGNVQDLIDQCFIDSATWGLDRWEEFVGIVVDRSKPIEERRQNIKAKVIGSGTATKQLIKDIAEAFAGEVDVIENFADGSFIVKFIGTRGVPQNMGDFQSRIYNVKPAHLGVSYEFTYITFVEIEDNVWNQLDTMSWDNLETSKI